MLWQQLHTFQNGVGGEPQPERCSCIIITIWTRTHWCKHTHISPKTHKHFTACASSEAAKNDFRYVLLALLAEMYICWHRPRLGQMMYTYEYIEGLWWTRDLAAPLILWLHLIYRASSALNLRKPYPPLDPTVHKQTKYVALNHAGVNKLPKTYCPSSNTLSQLSPNLKQETKSYIYEIRQLLTEYASKIIDNCKWFVKEERAIFHAVDAFKLSWLVAQGGIVYSMNEWL